MNTLTITEDPVDQKLNKTITNVINHVRENPEAKDVTFSVDSILERGFRSEIKVRDFNFIVDEPHSLGGENEAPNPVEYVLGALASCQEIVIKAYAGQLGIKLNSIRVEASGDLDLAGFFNISNERPGFNQVRYSTVISTDERDLEKLQLLKDFSSSRCPVLDIIANPVPVTGDVVFTN
ncbi:MAG: OsmC family protein [Balneolaceae bacterium]